MLFCPKCTETLHIADRQGIEIDFCPICRGVWLDGGELEKIIERTIQTELRHAEQSRPEPERVYHEQKPRSKDKYHKYDKDKRGEYGKKYYKKYKKKHVLKEIFDLFD